MNPKAYCLTHGISTARFIELAREAAPKYSKAVHCMASDRAYGVVLRASVARHVRGTPEARKLPCRLYLRCSQALRERLTAARDALGYGTYQDLLLHIVREWAEKNAAPAAGTAETAEEQITPKESLS